VISGIVSVFVGFVAIIVVTAFVTVIQRIDARHRGHRNREMHFTPTDDLYKQKD
jgi:hypothetical protein